MAAGYCSEEKLNLSEMQPFWLKVFSEGKWLCQEMSIERNGWRRTAQYTWLECKFVHNGAIKKMHQKLEMQIEAAALHFRQQLFVVLHLTAFRKCNLRSEFAKHWAFELELTVASDRLLDIWMCWRVFRTFLCRHKWTLTHKSLSLFTSINTSIALFDSNFVIEVISTFYFSFSIID